MTYSKHRKRLQAVLAMIVLVAIPVAVVASDVFEDVPDNNVHHDDISWLAAAGVTLGCNPPENTMFCPDDPVLRQQMASFLRRLAENQIVDAGRLEGMTADELLENAQGSRGSAGPEGPEGPRGPAGPAGPAGNANVHTFELTVLDTDWGNGLHYGDNNVYRGYDVAPSGVGGRNLRDYFNNGGTVLVYGQPVGNNSYNESKLLPHLFSLDLPSPSADIGIRLEYSASRGTLFITETINGWDSVVPEIDELPEETHFRLVLIDPAP